MRRLIETRLVDWANSSRRKPLLVRGARQVGKTYSIKRLGQLHFAKLVVLDFERNRDLHRVFSGNLDAQQICSELELLTSSKIEPQKTLLFFDEIQACPRAIMALRYFYEEMPKLHVIAAGSLLEFALADISFPVGRIQSLEMTPMTFAEYLWAIGNEAAASTVLSEPHHLSESIHRYLNEELKRYCFIGGMPESLAAYLETKSIQESFEVQKEICETYRQDFSKYARRADPRCLDEVWLATARSVGQQIKYANFVPDFSGPTIKAAFNLLCQAKVIKKIISTNPSGLPLETQLSLKRFKAILVDVGLWQHLCGMKTSAEYARDDLLNIYRGAMAEQLVGQEIAAAQNSDLFYWSRAERSSSAEVDYLAVVDKKIHAIEVKSGAAGKLRSLHQLRHDFPNCGEGLVFSSAPYSELKPQKLKFIPLYFAYSATKNR